MERPPSSFVVLFFFILFFSLAAVTTFLQKSPTMDEPIHLFAGYSYLKWGDFRTNPEHPPFAKMWAALPLLPSQLADVRETPHWDFIPRDGLGISVVDCIYRVFFTDNSGEALFFRAKLQMIFIGMLLGIFIYLWAKTLFGFEAGLAALSIYALDPNVLAHTSMIHTDLPLAAFFFIGTYFFSRSLAGFNARNVLCAAAFFALATITKYSAVTILPIWMILAGAFFFSPALATGGSATADSRMKQLAKVAAVLFVAVLGSYIFIWGIYGFRFDAIPGGAQHLDVARVLPAQPTVLGRFFGFLLEHRLLPEAWIYGQLTVIKGLQRPAYLLGWISPSGFWSYFPVAFLVKTPLPTLALICVGIGLAVRGINRPQATLLMIPALLYFAFAVLARTNIGLRHILPVYPFLFVLAGGAAGALWRNGRWMKQGVVLLGIWAVWVCVSTFPDYLAYFNELIGGPRNGYRVLVDSNLDWGQDLKGLKRWMDQNGVRKIQFAYFGWVDPEYYGIDAAYIAGAWLGYDPPATQTAERFEYVAVSAQFLYGPESERSRTAAFRSRKPVAIIGHSIFVYKSAENSVRPTG